MNRKFCETLNYLLCRILFMVDKLKAILFEVVSKPHLRLNGCVAGLR